MESIRQYNKHEPDAAYRVARFYVVEHWGDTCEMVAALTVFLQAWLRGFYIRFGMFDGEKLGAAIEKHLTLIEGFAKRDICTLTSSDEEVIEELFNAFVEALAIADQGKTFGRKSPIAAAKTLHLLAPSFFPVWDEPIAKFYGCYYGKGSPAVRYNRFCTLMQQLATQVRHFCPEEPDALTVKLIDMYLWAKHSKGWLTGFSSA